MLKNKRVLVFWLLTAAWTWVMFSLSGQPAQESAQLSGGLTVWVLRMLSIPEAMYGEVEHILRKGAHFCMFGLEGILLSLSLLFTTARMKKSAAISAAAIVVLAALNEFVQTFSEGRSCELKDVCIDSAGGFLGIAFAALCYYLMKSRRQA